MSDRGNQDWIPIAAGVVVGAGLLALIYKMLGSGCRKAVNTPYNQQMYAMHKCTCTKGGKDAVRLVSVGPKENENNEMGTKTNHSAQTDEPNGIGAFFSAMYDNIGPWIPFIGGSALVFLLLGLLSQHFNELVGLFEFEDKPSMPFYFEPPNFRANDPCGCGGGHITYWPGRQ